jgi:hypothetical protein
MFSRAPEWACCLINLLVLEGGCASIQQAGPAQPPLAPVPEYGVGDSYQFSDGATESVITIDHDAVQWRDNDGISVTSRDVLLPRLAWSDTTVHGERRIATATPLLFPLQPGKSVEFGAIRTVLARWQPGPRLRYTRIGDATCRVLRVWTRLPAGSPPGGLTVR